MLGRLITFADRNSAANQWLDKNPAVLGGISILIGGLLLYFGIRDLKRGVTRDKFGREVSGGMASLISIVRAIGGTVAGGFGLYKLLFG